MGVSLMLRSRLALASLAGWLIGPGLLSMLVLGGCREHRITQTRFMQMQRQQPPAPAKPAPVLTRPLLEPYRIGPDDVLAVTVVPSNLSAPAPVVQVRVNDDGDVDLPLAGKVRVAGMRLSEAESAIKAGYVPDYHSQAAVNVQVLQTQSIEVLVRGAVSQPGLVQLHRNERNLLHAVTRAGGASELASGHVTLQRLREPQVQDRFDLSSSGELLEALASDPLDSGDIVTVEAADPNTVFVGGLVNLSSPQAYPSGTEVTILQALAAAGGVRMDLMPSDATLIRRQDGGDVFVKLDLDRISKGKDPNMTLAAGDILWVPHTFGTRVREFLNNTLYLQAGASYTANYSDLGGNFRGDVDDTENTVLIP